MKNRHRTVCEEELLSSGITIKQMAERQRSFRENFLKCLWNGFIIFLFTVGLTSIFSASFGMPCSYPVLIAVCAVSSFAFALLYMSTAIYNAGYFLLMFIIIALIVVLCIPINSGYNAVLNIMTEAVKEDMNLPYLREHMEMYANRSVTITVFMGLIGSVLAMLFNMYVSRRRGVATSFIVLFTVLEVCIYLNDDISYLCLGVLLLAAVLFVITVQNDPVPINKKKKQKSWHTEKRTVADRGGRVQIIVLHREKSGHRLGAAFALAFVAATFLVSSFCFGLMSKKFINTDSALKKSSDRLVKAVAMNGMDGLFMRNSTQSRGGMSNGSFGDVSSVYLDYETDLEISLVPYTYAPVYLPTYTGSVYDQSKRQWRNAPDYKPGYTDTYKLLSDLGDSGEWDKYKLLDVNMLIKNVGVAPIYSEYGAVSFDDVSYTGVGFSGYYSENVLYLLTAQEEDDYSRLGYYACLLDYDEYAKLGEPDINSDEFYGIYTEVPENIREELEKICAAQGFSGDKADIIEQIQDYLAEGFGYTVSPGKTPSNRDFVLYFLKEKKQGFCVHFASSACLLLRTMGIPARYAEGYCFDYTVYEEALPYEGDNTEWNEGYSALDYDQPVTVELTDGNAHAWVEVYFEELGWVPVEFTVGTVIEDGSMGIMEFLGDIFGFGTGIDREPGVGQNFFNDAGEAIQNWFESRFGELVLIVLAAAAAVLLLKYFIYIFRAYIMSAESRAIFQYRTMARRARKRLMRHRRERRDYYGRLIISFDVMRELLADGYGVDAEYADNAMSAYERFNYSDHKNERDIRGLTRIYRRLIRIITWGRIKKSDACPVDSRAAELN